MTPITEAETARLDGYKAGYAAALHHATRANVRVAELEGLLYAALPHVCPVGATHSLHEAIRAELGELPAPASVSTGPVVNMADYESFEGPCGEILYKPKEVTMPATGEKPDLGEIPGNCLQNEHHEGGDESGATWPGGSGVPSGARSGVPAAPGSTMGIGFDGSAGRPRLQKSADSDPRPSEARSAWSHVCAVKLSHDGHCSQGTQGCVAELPEFAEADPRPPEAVLCSFCDKPNTDVRLMIVKRGSVAICNECMGDAVGAALQREAEQRTGHPEPDDREELKRLAAVGAIHETVKERALNLEAALCAIRRFTTPSRATAWAADRVRGIIDEAIGPESDDDPRTTQAVKPYRCVACGVVDLPSSGMCEQCSRAWGLGFTEGQGQRTTKATLQEQADADQAAWHFVQEYMPKVHRDRQKEAAEELARMLCHVRKELGR